MRKPGFDPARGAAFEGEGVALASLVEDTDFARALAPVQRP